jgi:hypothetical protein
MRNRSSPPATIWACVIHAWFHSLPFSSALWMYTFSDELFSVKIVKVFPVPGFRMLRGSPAGCQFM